MKKKRKATTRRRPVRTAHRSAISGRFVTLEAAQQDPSTTYADTVPLARR